jgi:hypothetical protein
MATKKTSKDVTKIVRYRLVTWFESFDDEFSPSGKNKREHIAHFGEEITLPEQEFDRIMTASPDHDKPFYPDDIADQIREGTYRGPELGLLTRARQGQFAPPRSEEEQVEGEGPQEVNLTDLSSEQLAEYIKANSLSAPDTVALAGDDEDSINKVLDAEVLATGNAPRDEVVTALEAKLTARTPAGS